MHGWSNDKIRTYYKINGTMGATLGEFSNDGKNNTGKKFLTEEEKRQVVFKKKVSSKHQIFYEFSDELKGIKNYLYLWENSDTREDAYSNWNFTEVIPWVNLWYSPNTTLLATTVIYKIGYESIEKINLELESQNRI